MKLEGLKALDRKLDAMPKAAKAEIAKALDKSADEMVSHTRVLAPELEGDLRASIRKYEGRHELQRFVSAGSEATPAGPVEHGHSGFGVDGGAAPRPFFYPAYRLIRRRLRGRISRATNKAAKMVAGDGSA